MHNQDAVNDYLAKISSKEEYNSSELDRFHCEGSTESYQPLYNYEVERLLSEPTNGGARLAADACMHVLYITDENYSCIDYRLVPP